MTCREEIDGRKTRIALTFEEIEKFLKECGYECNRSQVTPDSKGMPVYEHIIREQC